MSRSAQLTRKTGETDVSVALDLDGGPPQRIATGVGFFDHMLDLLACHGRVGLGVTVAGDLETGAHHTVEDTGIVLGQRRVERAEQFVRHVRLPDQERPAA